MATRVSHGIWLAGLVLCMLAVATPAHAERLTFDHRLYPALKAVLDAGDPGMIDYDAGNPRHVVDLVAVKGKSAAQWEEALEIVARTPAGAVRSARDWVGELRAQADRLCPNTVTVVAQDAGSVTFERHSPGCRSERAETAITRVLGSRRSLFALTFLFKGVPDNSTRDQALAMLASAHIE